MASRATSWGNGHEKPTSKRSDDGNNFGSEVPLFNKARQRAEEFYDGLGLQRRVEQHPVLMLAAAWGIGFVLGGGLTSTLAKRGLGMGLKAGMKLLVPMIAETAWKLTKRQGNASSQKSGVASAHE